MTTFAERLERSRRMYESGEEWGRVALSQGRQVVVPIGWPRHERASYLLAVYCVDRFTPIFVRRSTPPRTTPLAVLASGSHLLTREA